MQEANYSPSLELKKGAIFQTYERRRGVSHGRVGSGNACTRRSGPDECAWFRRKADN